MNDPLPGGVRTAPLTTSTGRQVTLKDFAGKIVVISDIMTLCQETCPLDTGNIVAAARRVERAGLGGKVTFLSITIDPQRDTRARLQAYRKLYAPAPADWLTLTGSPATLSAFWKSLGIFIQKVPDQPPAPKDWLTGKPLTYDLQHSDEVYFVDRHGNERFVLDGAAHLAKGAPIPPRLKSFLDALGRRNLNDPSGQAWTLPQALQVLSWLTGSKLSTSPAS